MTNRTAIWFPVEHSTGRRFTIIHAIPEKLSNRNGIHQKAANSLLKNVIAVWKNFVACEEKKK
jgi:hypothetical protein